METIIKLKTYVNKLKHRIIRVIYTKALTKQEYTTDMFRFTTPCVYCGCSILRVYIKKI